MIKTYVFEEELNKLNNKYKKFFWNSKTLTEDSNGFKTVEYDSFMNNECAFKDALNSVLIYGAVLVQNVVIVFINRISNFFTIN